MTQYFQVHPENPQRRLLFQASEILRKSGVVVYPTDSAYALGCRIGDRSALDRIRELRQLDAKHHFTLACRNLSEVASYARISDPAYRLIRACTPGPYTFILPGTKLVPKRLMHPKQRTIGLRVPDSAIAQALLEVLGEPLMTTTLILPGEQDPMTDPELIRDRLSRQVELVIDGGFGTLQPTTLVDMTDEGPEVLRVGLGDPSPFQ